jgi:hypothetical protein
MIESEMPQLIVVAEPDLSVWQAVGLPESNPDLEERSWVESSYCAAGTSGNRDSAGEWRQRIGSEG